MKPADTPLPSSLNLLSKFRPFLVVCLAVLSIPAAVYLNSQKQVVSANNGLTAEATHNEHHDLLELRPSSVGNSGEKGSGMVSVSVGTNPTGRSFTVDSVTYNSPQYFQWPVGSTHTISTMSPQEGTAGTQYTWDSWSDGGEQSHTITASTSNVYVANFTTQYYLTVCCNSFYGAVAPPSGYFEAEQRVSLWAQGLNGFNFWYWTGSGNGSCNGPGCSSVVMNGPIYQSAIFEGNPPTQTPTPSPTPTPLPILNYQVNTTNDSRDAVPGDAICADSGGMCSLRAAISESNIRPENAVIQLPAGVYTQELSDAPENQNLAGDWDLTGSVTIVGAGSEATILQANALPDTASERVLHCLNNAVVVINGVTVRNGKHLFVSAADDGGGGIAIEGAGTRLTLNGVVVTNNISQSRGGGIRVADGQAVLTINNGTISNNRAGSGVAGSSAVGGGIDMDGVNPTSLYNDSWWRDTVITENTVESSVASAYGGGIGATARTVRALCSGCQITNNRAISTAAGAFEGSGGGTYNSNSSLTFYSTKLSANTASHSAGGLRVARPPERYASIYLGESTVSDNSAPTAGGIMTNGDVDLYNSTISGNTAFDPQSGVGGGIYNYADNGDRALVGLTFSTVSGNRAAYGGGIFNGAGSNLIRVSTIASTIAANIATVWGGGLLQQNMPGGSITIKHTIVADNGAPVGPDLNGTITSAGRNHIEETRDSIFIPGTGDVTGIDAQLGPLADNGGPTLTHVPALGSPVIDTLATSGNSPCSFYSYRDQRGYGFYGFGCDKGSTELQSGPSPTPTPAVAVTVGGDIEGATFYVDGAAYTTTQTFSWGVGTTHYLGAISPHNASDGTRYIWNSWSDGGAINHNVTATVPATYTADFTKQYRLTTCCTDLTFSNNVLPVTGYFDDGATVPITASSDSGFVFRTWFGSGDGSYTGPLSRASVVMNGPVTQYALFETPLANKTSFDYDGDQRSDISVFRPSDGNWYLQRSQAGFIGISFGVATDKIVPADYDGDGRTDLAVFRPSDGNWYIANSSDGTFTVRPFGLEDDIPAPADYDGDGFADITVFRPSNGTWYIWNTFGEGSFTISQFGQEGDQPAIGDFDGDHKSDISVFRPSNGDWYRLNSSDGEFIAEQFGFLGDKIVQANFDLDAKTDIAVYRPSTGIWYIKAANGFSAVNFGLIDDIPAAGDFDGDGIDDIAVFRPSDGTWYIANSSNGSYTVYQFGSRGDRPTQSAFGN